MLRGASTYCRTSPTSSGMVGVWNCLRSFSTSVSPGGLVPDDELADLMASDAKPSNVKSPWRDNIFNRNSILFPNVLLETSRSSDLNMRNADRLSQLWSMSNSHGVSWDELDDAFLAFHREYMKAENDWVENYAKRWDQEYANCEKRLRSTLQGDEAQITLLMSRRRGKVRRMTYTRLARLRNKEILKTFSLDRFTDYMRQMVSQRMAKREEAEKNI